VERACDWNIAPSISEPFHQRCTLTQRDITMADEHTPSVSEQLSDVVSTVTEGVKSAATTVKETIEEGRKPGNSLDTLSKVVRQAPLAALIVAFLIGRASKRRW
jgi:hypothetical protein